MTYDSAGLLNENSVRRVLHIWDSLKSLGASPLACLRIVEARRREIAGEVLFNLGLACAYRGDILTGRDYLEQGLHIQIALGDGRAEAYALNALGFTL